MTTKSTISAVLARKISTADHIVWGNSLVLAAYYHLASDKYSVGVFDIEGTKLHTELNAHEDPTEACKCLGVKEFVNSYLDARQGIVDATIVTPEA